MEMDRDIIVESNAGNITKDEFYTQMKDMSCDRLYYNKWFTKKFYRKNMRFRLKN